MKVAIAGLLVVVAFITPARAQSAIGGPHKQTNSVGGPVTTPDRVVPPRRGTPIPRPTNSPSTNKRR